MKRTALFISTIMLVLLASSILGAEEPVLEKFTGTWNMAPNARAKSGVITFKPNGLYEKTEKLVDGDKVGAKGEFKVDLSARPFRIDLCLDQCGKPGSEWTTLFGIFRFLSDTKLEIKTSPDGKYPTGFSDDNTKALTMILTRADK